MSESELERFRREWQEEVRARDSKSSGPRGSHLDRSALQTPGAQVSSQKSIFAQNKSLEDDRVLEGGWNFDNIEKREENASHGLVRDNANTLHPEPSSKREPSTALDFYERAVESENQGRLGESVANYRQAFRLNDRVDQQYRNKHFPPPAFSNQLKAEKEALPNTSPSIPIPAHASLHSGTQPGTAISELLASFAGERIKGALPIIERDIPPPCPITKVPSEVLGEILRFSALDDVASFMRLALVCKCLAYQVAVDSRVWKELCLSSRYGFNCMHFKFACTLHGVPLNSHILSEFDDLNISDHFNDQATVEATEPHLRPLRLTPQFPSYAMMFHHRPRLRFAGVYISTVNYARPGASSPTQLTWNSPIHIVTYYRYLRFYRDGTCISLLTTVEPMEVVPYFHMRNIREAAGSMAVPGFGAVAKYTLRGRWRMSALHSSSSADDHTKDARDEEIEPEGNVLIETDGPTPPLVYTMQLALRSNHGSGAKNTKLIWRGFWSYNKITDDWAEFGLRNDRPYVWSRVKSWANV